MTDFIVGIAQFAYLIFIFWSAFALWLVLLFDLPARERHWLRDHWWEKLIPDQEIDRDIKIATEQSHHWMPIGMLYLSNGSALAKLKAAIMRLITTSAIKG